MTPETVENLLDSFWRTDDGRTASERAEVYGIDLSLIRENLRLTPEERLAENDRVLTECEHLIAAHE